MAVMRSVAAMAARHEPTVIVARRARPGREREFERWIRRLVARAADAPGAVDAELQPPNDLHPGEWVVVYRFMDNDSLERWLHSPTRTALIAAGNELVEGDAREQIVALTPGQRPGDRGQLRAGATRRRRRVPCSARRGPRRAGRARPGSSAATCSSR